MRLRQLVSQGSGGQPSQPPASPDRNRDSQAQSLIDQGFRLVALPEFVLMTAASEQQNLVSLYQKEVEEGEIITIGKWAVPVFWP